MKQFISVNDVSNINALVEKALMYKADPFKDRKLGADKRMGLLFLNPSLRTRLSTQVAAANLGMEAIVFNVDKEGWALEFEEGAIMSGNTVEHIKDAAPILGSYFDILCIRTFPSLKNREDDYRNRRDQKGEQVVRHQRLRPGPDIMFRWAIGEKNWKQQGVNDEQEKKAAQCG